MNFLPIALFEKNFQVKIILDKVLIPQAFRNRIDILSTIFVLILIQLGFHAVITGATRVVRINVDAVLPRMLNLV